MNAELSSNSESATEATPKKIIEGKKLPKNTNEAAKFVTNIKDLVSDSTAGKDKTIAIINNLKKELGKETDRDAEIARLAIGLELGSSVVASLKKIASKQANMELAIREEDELNNIDLNIFVGKALGITGDLTDLAKYFDDVSQALGIETKFNLKEELSNRSKSRRKFLRTSAVAAATVGLVAVGVSSYPFEKKPTTSPKTPTPSPTPEVIPAASPVPAIKELTPPPPVVTPVPQEQERLIPNPIRMLRNEKLNNLWKAGEIELRKVLVNGREVIVIDAARNKPNPHLKFGSVYANNPVDDRVFSFNSGRTPEYVTKQVLSTCATHSFVNAALFLGEFKDGRGVPIVMNPLLLAEVVELTPQRYEQLKSEIIGKDEYKKTYGTGLGLASQTGALNLGIQEMDFNNPGLSPLEKAIKSVFGINLNRNVVFKYPNEAQNLGRVTFDIDMFSSDQWTNLKSKFSFEIINNQVVTSREIGEQIYGLWLEDWYNGLTANAESQSQRIAPLFSLRWDETGINHLFVILGTQIRNGKTYFRTVEPHAGEVSDYLYKNGLIKDKDGTCYIPVNKLWKIGISGIDTMSTDKQPVNNVNVQEAAIALVSKEREVLRTEQLGFRVNSAEAIRRLPDGIGLIRIAGNATQVNASGEFTDHSLKEMLDLAGQKGLKVVFVYNPTWFPGIPGGNTNMEMVNKNYSLIRDKMKAQLTRILQHKNVILEIGNEPDDVYWDGSAESFGKFFQMASGLAKEISPETKLLLAAYSDPQTNIGQVKRLVAYLNKPEVKAGLPDFAVAVHAYDSASLAWDFNNFPQIFASLFEKKKMEMIVTEMNSDRRNTALFQQELQRMLDIVRQKQVTSLIHEYKPEAFTLDPNTGANYNINPTDPRFGLVMNSVNALLADTRTAVVQKEHINL